VEQVEEDLEILQNLAAHASRRWQAVDDYDVVGLVDEFAQCLRMKLGSSSRADESSAAPATTAVQKPISGLSLLLAAGRGALARLLRFRPSPREKGSP